MTLTAEIAKKYKYITFILVEEKPKMKVWSCVNNRSHGELGQVKWHSAWRRYSFFPSQWMQTIFDRDCLLDVVAFLGVVMKERKREVERDTDKRNDS